MSRGEHTSTFSCRLPLKIPILTARFHEGHVITRPYKSDFLGGLIGMGLVFGVRQPVCVASAAPAKAIANVVARRLGFVIVGRAASVLGIAEVASV
jgi:hypothetical protein